jgi:hypothetical protein
LAVLQPNNSQCGNCQIRNTRISTASVTPMLGIPAKRHVGPSKADFVTCSTCFIRCTSGSVLSTALLAVFAICTHITAIAPARPIAQSSSSALSQSSMKREHCGNFSVAHIVMSAEVSKGPGVIPAPPRRRRVARCFHTRGGTVVQATLSSFMHEQRKIPKERYSKSSDSTSSHNSADFKVSHDPHSDCLDLTWLFSSCQFLQTAASHFLRRHFFVGPLPTAPAAHPFLAMSADGCLHDGRGALTEPSPRLPRRRCSACGRFSGIASNAVCTALMRSLFRTAICLSAM